MIVLDRPFVQLLLWFELIVFVVVLMMIVVVKVVVAVVEIVVCCTGLVATDLLVMYHFDEAPRTNQKMPCDFVRVLNDASPVAFVSSPVRSVSIEKDKRMVRYESKNHKRV